jgi:hypothetical protein
MSHSLYDCFNAKVCDKEILCSAGYRLGVTKPGIHSMRLQRGDKLELTVCAACPSFEQMDGGKVDKDNRGWKK